MARRCLPDFATRDDGIPVTLDGIPAQAQWDSHSRSKGIPFMLDGNPVHARRESRARSTGIPFTLDGNPVHAGRQFRSRSTGIPFKLDGNPATRWSGFFGFFTFSTSILHTGGSRATVLIYFTLVTCEPIQFYLFDCTTVRHTRVCGHVLVGVTMKLLTTL